MKHLSIAILIFMTCAQVANARPQAAESRYEGLSTVFVSDYTVSANHNYHIGSPEVESFEQTSIVTLTFDIPGCLDKLASVNYHIEQKDDHIDLYVAGNVLRDKRSIAAYCIRQPSVRRAIVIPGIHDELSVNVKRLQTASFEMPVDEIKPPMTCMAYWSGYIFNETLGTCQRMGASGCSNPFEFQDLASCRDAHDL